MKKRTVKATEIIARLKEDSLIGDTNSLIGDTIVVCANSSMCTIMVR
jgi:hypothetical protein